MGKLLAKKQPEKSTVRCTPNFIRFFKNLKHLDIAITWHS
jgi:hypothetical protein